MNAIDPQLRILEIGEFSLFNQFIPEQTTFIFTGANPGRMAGIPFRRFTPATMPAILRSFLRGDWDLVFCYPPAMPLWDRRRGALGMLSTLARVLSRFQTLGTYLARRSKNPLVVLDFNDMSSIPAPGLALLDRSVAYFKRELPLDPAKALFNVAPRFRTHERVMSSRFYERNRSKLMPISIGISEETVRMAVRLTSEKTVDVFFAGSSAHSEIRRRGFEQLRALAQMGYVVDICHGGLSKREYLERCARSWLTWSPEGFGWECFRHYEAGLCLSVPILSAPSITRYAPLLEGVHAYNYPVESNGLIDVVQKALAQKPTLEIMARSAREHIISHHTHARLCEHIVAHAATAIAREVA